MGKLHRIIDEGIELPVGPFASWEEARAFKAEHLVPGFISAFDDPTTPIVNMSRPEPQEMTVRIVRQMQRAA